MLERSKFTPDQLLFAIENREFEEGLLASAPMVVCVMTQSWCPQWIFMRSWLKKLVKHPDESEGLKIQTFETEYDKSPVFSEFREFKEQIWNNWEVPYLRYYVHGQLAAESNFVSSMMFLDNLRQAEKKL